jgi:hypothetical protein
MQVKTRAFAWQMCINACMSAGWDDLRTVLMLVRHGSLAGAAGELGIELCPKVGDGLK